MREVYIAPSVEIIRFENADIITGSIPESNDDNETGLVPGSGN